MYNSTTTLDQIALAQSAHAATINNLLAAASASLLFGIRQSLSGGLVVGFYGGNFLIAGTPTYLADQTITLTASATNYIYATSSGVVTKTTSIPSGWPGPLAASAMALYTLVTDASKITSGTDHLIGIGVAGVQGIQGIQGQPGIDMPNMHLRFSTTRGNSSLVVDNIGWSNWTISGGTGAVARALSSASFEASICQVAYETSASAGIGTQIEQGNGFWCYLGNGAGRGGFLFSVRFRIGESGKTVANQRSFFGLWDSNSTIANVEPDTLTNIIGIGAKAGDANFSFIHNDAAGTATMASLGSNFPARATDTVYEMTLQSVANSGTVSYTLLNVSTGNTATGNTSSDLPSNTTFLGGTCWVNNGSTAAVAAFSLMQIVGETRY